MSCTIMRSVCSSSLIQSIKTRISSFSLGFSKDLGSIIDRSSFSSSWYSSGGISADLGIPGESMACLPSTSTSLTSSVFFFLPSVPTLVQKVSSVLEGSLGVEVAAGEFALLGLGEDIMVLFLDLGKDIFELRSEAQRLRKRSALSAQGHS